MAYSDDDKLSDGYIKRPVDLRRVVKGIALTGRQFFFFGMLCEEPLEDGSTDLYVSLHHCTKVKSSVDLERSQALKDRNALTTVYGALKRQTSRTADVLDANKLCCIFRCSSESAIGPSNDVVLGSSGRLDPGVVCRILDLFALMSSLLCYCQDVVMARKSR